MWSNIRLLLIAERRDRFFCASCDHWVKADNCIPCCQLIVGHLNRPVLPQHCLEAINGWGPGEVLNPAKRLSHVPGDHHPIPQFLHVTRAGHAWLEEHTDRWDGVDERAGGFL